MGLETRKYWGEMKKINLVLILFVFCASGVFAQNSNTTIPESKNQTQLVQQEKKKEEVKKVIGQNNNNNQKPKKLKQLSKKQALLQKQKIRQRLRRNMRNARRR